MRKSYYIVVLVLVGYLLGQLRALPSVADTARSEAPAPKQQRVGLQVGHWLNADLPDEFRNKLAYSLGGEVNGLTEWELCLDIAQRTKTKLESDGYAVDLLPATVPENYLADAFLSLHTDGNDDTTVRGYKVAATAWDETSRSTELSEAVQVALGSAADLPTSSYISEEMNEYYAFNFTKYDHAVSPSTPAVIVELGFLTNRDDRQYLVYSSDQVAESLRQGVNSFLDSN